MTPLLLLLLAPLPAHADSHAVTIRNDAPETIRAIQVGPPGRLGENRMRSQLPTGAEARITYSTGCQADLRLTYASGQTEDHPGLDLCSDPRIAAGQSATSQPATSQSATPQSATPQPATPGPTVPIQTQATASAAKPKPTPAAAHPTAARIDKTPLPPWTGHSITRRFGGMD